MELTETGPGSDDISSHVSAFTRYTQPKACLHSLAERFPAFFMANCVEISFPSVALFGDYRRVCENSCCAEANISMTVNFKWIQTVDRVLLNKVASSKFSIFSRCLAVFIGTVAFFVARIVKHFLSQTRFPLCVCARACVLFTKPEIAV